MRGTAGYRLLLAAAVPLVFAHSLARSWRDGGWRYLRQRWGFGYPPKDPGLRPQWVHCASVGEVSAAAPLIARLSASGEPLLVTTSTPTGAAQLSRRFPDLPHVYLPLDYPVVLRRFLRHLRPARLLVVETEIWPCLYSVCHQARVPIVIVNARLSARTLEAPRWLRRAYADSLARVSAILARSDVDAERFVTLGAPSARVETCGNLKFSARPPLPVESVVPDRPYLLAASTRD
ncbi:MAG: 3-deoxy-D-manno-octulosonic acid transferase, partial [Halothiobacillaceae bacterium]